jgi:hypothetical protein
VVGVEVPARKKMIKKYDFKNLISLEENINCIKVIDELFENDNWCKTVPYYQTFANLFTYKEFYKLKHSFILSCFSYLNEEVKYFFPIKSWCHRSYYSYQIKQDRDTHWHSHGEKNEKRLSGLFYLHVPKDVPDYESSGTEFKEFPNIIPEDFCWFIFPSHLVHRHGKIQSDSKRYVLACDFDYIEEGETKKISKIIYS